MLNPPRDSHQYGWYYGLGHFIVRAIPFVCDGLGQRARILTVMEPGLAEPFSAAVRRNFHTEVPPQALGLLPLCRLGNALSVGGVPRLRRELIGLLLESRRAGCHRLRVLGQVSEELRMTGKSLEEFLAWEQAFHEAGNGLPIDTLCMYDASLMVQDHQLRSCHHDSLTGRGAARHYLVPVPKRQRR